MQIALAMIVAARDEEAEVLDRCLSYIAPYVDKIFITITGDNKKCNQVANKYKAVVSRFTWINDFAAARNYNFSQVPKEYDYILWLDADDVLRDADKLRKVIEEHPADAYILNYLYNFDENNNPDIVHMKTQVIKNDGCVEWAGELHEDFRENRSLTSYFIKGIERLHLSTGERFNDAKNRNLEVATNQIEKHPDDPRAYWNMANALGALFRFQESVEMFDKFMESSNSEEEKYIARLRRAEAFSFMGEPAKAIDECRYAIGSKPTYPDAYFMLGKIYMTQRSWEKAFEQYMFGLVKKPPVYGIIVYNPRDYDYNPMYQLASICFSFERPDLAIPFLKGCQKIVKNEAITKLIREANKKKKISDEIIKRASKLEMISDNAKLKEELDKLPEELKSHPAICLIRNRNFVKTETSGKDLVYFCGFTQARWDGNSLKKGIGGSEEAVINLSRLLVKRGWNVTVYNNCGHKERIIDGVTYRPFWQFNQRDKQDVVILWRSPMAASYGLDAPKVYVDLHDTIKAGEFNQERLAKITKIFVKSKAHRALYPFIPDDKFVIIPNGITLEQFEEVEKDRKLMINTSSADRSLSAVCDVYEIVKKEIPDMKMKWAYGWGTFDIVHSNNPKMIKWKNDLIKRCEDLGIEMLGMISSEEVAKLYEKADILLYPSEFYEIDCISLTKAMACGCYPITTDYAAMGNKSGHGGLFVPSEKSTKDWGNGFDIDFALKDKDKLKWMADAIIKGVSGDRKEMKEYAKTYSWDLIVNLWEKELKS